LAVGERAALASNTVLSHPRREITDARLGR
jgi:hypothetical protein